MLIELEMVNMFQSPYVPDRTGPRGSVILV